ncbi:hypothetical protein AMELA_G00085630 [Ameiurus melas]|uniref:U1-type domain-containing protein n=1 Tax=Ameiurus melas TaxID=219545 RepID=A0A7J6AVA6_AMEME|nr:hypothetical protein AMELA_G00085630 [Ameiurus melas]
MFWRKLWLRFAIGRVDFRVPSVRPAAGTRAELYYWKTSTYSLLQGMKTPLSPGQLMENSPPYFPVTELMDGMVDVSTQERKKLLYSLCEVCNIQLNSAAQVQTHYNGKSHLRRVKQLNNGESPPASSSSVPNLLATTITNSSTGEAVYLFYLN